LLLEKRLNGAANFDDYPEGLAVVTSQQSSPPASGRFVQTGPSPLPKSAFYRVSSP